MAEQLGRVALVTGASRRVGIGCAIAAQLLAAGAQVMLHSSPPLTHDAEQPWGADPAGQIINVEAGFRRGG